MCWHTTNFPSLDIDISHQDIWNEPHNTIIYIRLAWHFATGIRERRTQQYYHILSMLTWHWYSYAYKRIHFAATTSCNAHAHTYTQVVVIMPYNAYKRRRAYAKLWTRERERRMAPSKSGPKTAWNRVCVKEIASSANDRDIHGQMQTNTRHSIVESLNNDRRGQKTNRPTHKKNSSKSNPGKKQHRKDRLQTNKMANDTVPNNLPE